MIVGYIVAGILTVIATIAVIVQLSRPAPDDSAVAITAAAMTPVNTITVAMPRNIEAGGVVVAVVAVTYPGTFVEQPHVAADGWSPVYGEIDATKKVSLDLFRYLAPLGRAIPAEVTFTINRPVAIPAPPTPVTLVPAHASAAVVSFRYDSDLRLTNILAPAGGTTPNVAFGENIKRLLFAYVCAPTARVTSPAGFRDLVDTKAGAGSLSHTLRVAVKAFAGPGALPPQSVVTVPPPTVDASTILGVGSG